MRLSDRLPRWEFLREIGILLALGSVIAAGTYASRRISSLEKQNEALTRMAFEPRAGLFIPEIAASSINGDSVILGEIGKRQLLLFFNAECPYCRASLPSWNEIADSLAGDSTVAVIGVAFDPPEVAGTYARDRGLRFPVVSKPEARLAGLYRITGVPTIVLTSHDGRMAYARVGPMEYRETIDSVLAAVAVEK